MSDLKDLIGKTMKTVTAAGDEMIFVTEQDDKYKLCHIQNCCEDVQIYDVCGNLDDLMGSPLLMAEETVSNDPPPDGRGAESYTWTFYRFATVKGYVTVRWFGESNGCYSESVDFRKM
jgi:hypothetical protein